MRTLQSLSLIAMACAMVPVSMAVAQDAPPPPPDAMSGAIGKGVKIIDAEPQAAALPVPPAPTYKPTGTTPHAVQPTALTSAPAGLKPCARPLAQPALSFADPAALDGPLRSKLRRGSAQVVLDIAHPYKASAEAPTPLSAWLNEVKQSGGAVEVKPYCQQGGRGFGKFFANLFGGGKPAEPYKAARKYDATLYVDALDQVVTQVEFTRRKAAR